MNTYELTILMPSENKGKEVEKILKAVTDFVKKAKGEVSKQESWGVKNLAYPIAKQSVAQYEYFVLKLAPSEQPKLDKMLRMDESLLRYMFVRV